MYRLSTITSTIKAVTAVLGVAALTACASGGHHPAGGHDESAIGGPGKAATVTRTVQVDISDSMRFSPANILAKQGETVRFVVKNAGQVKYEFVLGTEKELDAHAAQMVKFPTMEHDEPYRAHVAPGKTGEIIWNFNRAGDFDFARLMAGHYSAGMVGKVKLVAVAAGKKSDGHNDHKH